IDLFEKANVMFREAVRPRAVAQQRDVTERWLAIPFITLGNVGHGVELAAADIFGIEPYWTIPASGNAFGSVQAQKVPAGEIVEDPPDLSVRIGKEIGGRRLSARAPLEMEAQAVAAHTARTPLQRAHASTRAEGAVVHVGTVGEVPDLFAGRADEWQAVRPVETPGQPPRFSDEPAELAGESDQHGSSRSERRC